ncbi:MAG: RIP metalloprotease RseP [Candidatus Omnitrophota bacterium]
MWLVVLKPLIIIGIIAFLIIVHELGHFFAARLSGIKVEKFAIGFGPCIFKRMFKETLFLVHLVPLGGYVKMAGDERSQCKGDKNEFFSKSVGVRARVVFAGPLFNYLFSFLIFWFLFVVGMPVVGNKIGGSVDRSPAQKAGLQAGDRILEINRSNVKEWFDIQTAISVSRGSLNFLIERDGKEFNLQLTPELMDGYNVYGNKTEQRKIGIYPGDDNYIAKYNFFPAGAKAAEKMAKLTAFIVRGFYGLISGSLSFRETAGGPIAIYTIASKTIPYGPIAVLNFVSLIGVSLAIANLLPIPVLDGGHLSVFLVEKLIRRPISERAENVLTRIGWSVLSLLMVFIFYNDIMELLKPLFKIG